MKLAANLTDDEAEKIIGSYCAMEAWIAIKRMITSAVPKRADDEAATIIKRHSAKEAWRMLKEMILRLE